jgi:myosin-1
MAALVKTLQDCELHYVRCIKSNDEKRANLLTDKRVHHQITYLGAPW